MSELNQELNDPQEPSPSEVAYFLGQVINLSDGTKATVTRLPSPDNPYVSALVTDLPFVRELTYVFREEAIDPIKPKAFGKSPCSTYYEINGAQFMKSLDLEPRTA